LLISTFRKYIFLCDFGSGINKIRSETKQKILGKAAAAFGDKVVLVGERDIAAKEDFISYKKS